MHQKQTHFEDIPSLLDVKTDLQRDGLGTVIVVVISTDAVVAFQFVTRPVHIPAHLDVVV